MTLSPPARPPTHPTNFSLSALSLVSANLLPKANQSWLPELRRRAADQRWRVREAVAIGLQHWGDHDMHALVREMQTWTSGSWLAQRAVVAALAEPRLLRTVTGEDPTGAVLRIFDDITESIVAASTAARRDPAYQVLRQALGYAWSVLVAANPATCCSAFERWLRQAEASQDKDLLWIARQNLKKNRLIRLDPTWTASWGARLG